MRGREREGKRGNTIDLVGSLCFSRLEATDETRKERARKKKLLAKTRHKPSVRRAKRLYERCLFVNATEIPQKNGQQRAMTQKNIYRANRTRGGIIQAPQLDYWL